MIVPQAVGMRHSHKRGNHRIYAGTLLGSYPRGVSWLGHRAGLRVAFLFLLLRELKPLLATRVGAAGGRFAKSLAKVLGYKNVHNLAACLLRAAYGNLAILNCLLL